MMIPNIILITGNMASGKSTVAQALAERLPRSVHVRGDIFRRMIVNGQAEMSAELSKEARAQLELRYDLAVQVAKGYVKAGFTVVYQDIILGNTLSEFETRLQPCTISIIVLCPHVSVIAERERTRGKKGYQNEQAIHQFDDFLRFQTPHVGYWLDTSNLSVSETVEHILVHLEK